MLDSHWGINLQTDDRLKIDPNCGIFAVTARETFLQRAQNNRRGQNARLQQSVSSVDSKDEGGREDDVIFAGNEANAKRECPQTPRLII